MKVPPDQQGQLVELVGNLAPKRQGMSKKNRQRLRQIDDPANLHAWVTLPQQLMRQAERLGPKKYKGCLLAQTAVALELLIMAPVRISNLAAIEIGRQLVRHRHSGGMHLVFEPDEDEIKNDEPLDFPLPDESVALIDRYVKIFRPSLTLDQSNPALFPGRTVRFKGRHALGKQISAAVLDFAGIKFNPHLARHISSKTHLDANPGDYGSVQRVLGHRSIDTTMTSYCGMEAPAAARRYDNLVLALRHQAPPAPRRRK